MTAAATTSTQTPLGRLTALPNWAWSIVALAVIALLQFLLAGATFTGYLGDPDDAARQVQVRDFIAGPPLHNPPPSSLGGQAGLLSHWSRLVDLPIAAIITLVSAFSTVATGELVARAVWPLIVLAPLLFVIQRTATARAGDTAGYIALCPIAVTSIRP